MRPLWILGVTGLYQEFYQPDTRAIDLPNEKIRTIDQKILDSGRIFWNTILQRERVIKVVNALENNIHNPRNQIPQFLCIVADKGKFINDVLDYRVSICDQGIGPKNFFMKLETFAILCELYSRFEYHPFQLSIQNGFLLNEVSSKEIVYNCQSFAHNPHIAFINDVILPLVLDYSPDVIFCVGRISYFFIALAKMVKKELSNVHICFTRHSSEYYSLNKIDKYLRQNSTLFSVIDSIILEYFDESEKMLLENLESNVDISKLPNLLTYRDNDESNEVQRRVPLNTSISEIIGRKKQASRLKLSPDRIFDIHLDPYVKCYWNKCVFCGINKKYTHKDSDEDKDQLEKKIKNMCGQIPDNSFLWFIDEAIHPFKLGKISDYFNSNKLTYTWQARCRIDQSLLDNGLPEKLAKSGLKELRLGLESASIRILRLMGKFDDRFQLKTIEQIVKIYSELGVSIHFPIIVGFPGEEAADRQKTYEFLTTIHKKYPLVTFNINTFSFDVSSPMFKVWDRYAISQLKFPCEPDEFIGNIITWDAPTKPTEHILENERNSFMRSKLYPWMPPKAFISPIIFYRLSETIRNTLIWKSCKQPSEDLDFSIDKTIQRSPDMVVQKKTDGEYLAYNWNTHHYIEGNESMLKILNTWKLPKSVKQGVEELAGDGNEVFKNSDVPIILKKMLHHGHFVLVENG